MAIGDTYYALTLNARGTSTPAFYSVTPASNLQISQGGATIAPSPASSEGTTVNIYPQTLQISGPAGLISAGVTIISSAGNIAGRTVISPAVNVAVTVTLYGNGGAQLGQQVYDAGSGGGAFDFHVPAGSGVANADDARALLETFIKPAQ
jgi:hypothetical protein